MKQTAVEWLLNAIETKNGEEFSSYYSEFVEYAKEMEKAQIMDAYWDGGQDIPTSIKTCKWYYNETFNTK